MQQIKHTMQSELGDTEYLATGKNLTEQPCVFFSVSLCLSLFLSSSLPPACFTNCIRFCRSWTAPQLVYVIKKTFMSSQYCDHFKGKYGIQCRSRNGDDLICALGCDLKDYCHSVPFSIAPQKRYCVGYCLFNPSFQ